MMFLALLVVEVIAALSCRSLLMCFRAFGVLFYFNFDRELGLFVFALICEIFSILFVKK
jgi:hypothetical protein